MMPRFRGTAIEVEGGWSWEVLISPVNSNEGDIYTTKEIYKNRSDAIKGINEFVKVAMEVLSEQNPELNINPNNYYDMKINETKAWDKSDEH